MHETMLKGFNIAASIQVYWRVAEETSLQPLQRKEFSSALERVTNLYSLVLEYQFRAICHLSQASLFRGYENAMDSHDWKEKANEIEIEHRRCLEILPRLEHLEFIEVLKLQSKEKRAVQKIFDEIRKLLQQQEERAAERYKDVQENGLLQALYSSYKKDKNFVPLRVKNTCQWFFQSAEFKSWRDATSSSLLWLSGNPGCSKSVIARSLVDEELFSTKPLTSVVCYFFFKDGVKLRSHAYDALAAILHQLFRQDLTGRLVKNGLPYYPHVTELRENTEELWSILVECANSPDLGEVICILDALDECEDKSRETFLRELKDFFTESSMAANKSARIKFIITSRPEVVIKRDLGDITTGSQFGHVDGEIKTQQIQADINNVIDDQVNKVATFLSQEDRLFFSNLLQQTHN
jgi:ankyrin repeat domain-containing protein 50